MICIVNHHVIRLMLDVSIRFIVENSQTIVARDGFVAFRVIDFYHRFLIFLIHFLLTTVGVFNAGSVGSVFSIHCVRRIEYDRQFCSNKRNFFIIKKHRNVGTTFSNDEKTIVLCLQKNE